MNAKDRSELGELTDLIKKIFEPKYDPNNGGWRTARAVFEKGVTDELKNINTALGEIKETIKQIPENTNEIRDLKKWRGKINKVLASIATMIGTILTGIIIYYFTRG